MTEQRERFQLVISLGEGAEGQRLRELLDRAAERKGRPVSVWARELLLAAAGDVTGEGPIDPVVEIQYEDTQSSSRHSSVPTG